MAKYEYFVNFRYVMSTTETKCNHSDIKVVTFPNFGWILRIPLWKSEKRKTIPTTWGELAFQLFSPEKYWDKKLKKLKKHFTFGETYGTLVRLAMARQYFSPPLS